MTADRGIECNTERTRRQLIQLSHWKTLLMKQPHDELAFFWREQVEALEALLHRQQRVGSKRPADFDGMVENFVKREKIGVE